MGDEPSVPGGFFSACAERSSMYVGIISDTHDNVPAADAAMDAFVERGVETVIHCGDFVAPPLIPHLDRAGIEVHAVRGNNDGEREGLVDAFENLDGGTLHGRFAELSFDGRAFAVLHGEQRPVIDALASSEEYDYVCHGHWHVREERTVGETTVINPGAQFPTVPDEHRTVAVVDTEDDTVEFLDVTESI
nr:metallophosphoesterase [Natronomonas gomsonensis]